MTGQWPRPLPFFFFSGMRACIELATVRSRYRLVLTTLGLRPTPRLGRLRRPPAPRRYPRWRARLRALGPLLRQREKSSRPMPH